MVLLRLFRERVALEIVYNRVPYYFQKNLQGDIIGLVGSDGVVKVRYSYDAWGVCTVEQDSSGNGLSTINPYRYRCYYFDEAMGLYYLQSRYYNPVVGRFVNGDETTKSFLCCGYRCVCGNTMWYCHNNPIMFSDIMGYSPQINLIFDVEDIILGVEVDIGKGWRYRIDNKNYRNEHIHVYNRKASEGKWSQNKDGSPHDIRNNSDKKGPPKKVKDKIKEKEGWDWDEKARDYEENYRFSMDFSFGFEPDPAFFATGVVIIVIMAGVLGGLIPVLG